MQNTSLLEYYAEMQPILCKDSANRMQNTSLLEYYAEMQPILCKDIKKYVQVQSNEVWMG